MKTFLDVRGTNELDWSAPMAQYLSVAYLYSVPPVNGTYYDLVTQLPFTPATNLGGNKTAVASADGQGAYMDSDIYDRYGAYDDNGRDITWGNGLNFIAQIDLKQSRDGGNYFDDVMRLCYGDDRMGFNINRARYDKQINFTISLRSGLNETHVYTHPDLIVHSLTSVELGVMDYTESAIYTLVVNNDGAGNLEVRFYINQTLYWHWTGYSQFAELGRDVQIDKQGLCAINAENRTKFQNVYTKSTNWTQDEIDSLLADPYQVFQTAEEDSGEYYLTSDGVTSHILADIPDRTLVGVDDDYHIEQEFVLKREGENLFYIDRDGCYITDTTFFWMGMSVAHGINPDDGFHTYRGSLKRVANVRTYSLWVDGVKLVDEQTTANGQGATTRLLAKNDTDFRAGSIKSTMHLDHNDGSKSRYWEFNQTFGDTVIDKLNGVVATLIGFPVDAGYVRRRENRQGIAFNGTDEYASADNFDFSVDFVATMEIKIASGQAGWRGLFGTDTYTGSTGLTFYTTNTDRIWMVGSAGSSFTVPTGIDIYDGEFHIIKIIYSAGVMSCFVDGIKSTDEVTVTITNSTSTLNIAARHNNDGTGGKDYSECTVKSLRLESAADNRFYDLSTVKGLERTVASGNSKDATLTNFDSGYVFTTEEPDGGEAGTDIVGYRLDDHYNASPAPHITTPSPTWSVPYESDFCFVCEFEIQPSSDSAKQFHYILSAGALSQGNINFWFINENTNNAADVRMKLGFATSGSTYQATFTIDYHKRYVAAIGRDNGALFVEAIERDSGLSLGRDVVASGSTVAMTDKYLAIGRRGDNNSLRRMNGVFYNEVLRLTTVPTQAELLNYATTGDKSALVVANDWDCTSGDDARFPDRVGNKHGAITDYTAQKWVESIPVEVYTVGTGKDYATFAAFTAAAKGDIHYVAEIYERLNERLAIPWTRQNIMFTVQGAGDLVWDGKNQDTAAGFDMIGDQNEVIDIFIMADNPFPKDGMWIRTKDIAIYGHRTTGLFGSDIYSAILTDIDHCAFVADPAWITDSRHYFIRSMGNVNVKNSLLVNYPKLDVDNTGVNSGVLSVKDSVIKSHGLVGLVSDGRTILVNTVYDNGAAGANELVDGQISYSFDANGLNWFDGDGLLNTTAQGVLAGAGWNDSNVAEWAYAQGDVPLSVYSDVDIQFGILTNLVAVSNDLDLQFSMAERIQTDMDLRQAIFNAIYSDVDLRQAVLNAVQADKDFRWSLSGGVHNDLDIRNAIAQIVENDVDIRFALSDEVFNTVFVDIDIRNEILSNLISDLDIRQGMLNNVNSDIDLRYGTKNHIHTEVDIQTSILNVIASDLDVQYQLATQVANEVDVQFAMDASIVRDVDIRYGVNIENIVASPDNTFNLDLSNRTFSIGTNRNYVIKLNKQNRG